jgi:hypothetical protein
MTCGICKKDKNELFFSFKNKIKGKRHTTCKECHRVNSNNHYKRNKSECIARVRARNKRVIDDNKLLILDYLKGKCCVDCGEADPIVLEFDHINPATKIDNVSNISRMGSSAKKIIAEIEKCEIRCANCHRRKTAKQLGWYRA